MPDELLAERKRATRKQLADNRRRLDAGTLGELADQLAAVVLGMPEVRAAGTVACYASVGTEPGTGPLLDGLRAAGIRVLVPLTNHDMTLDWAEYTAAADLVPARFGLLEPAGPRLGSSAVAGADVVLLPAAAVSSTGVRLGRGGGCYDRVLEMLPATTVTCALLYADELLDEVPAEPHDRGVQLAATPVGVARFAS